MIIVVFNQKGGVGKSTISTNLAAQSAKLGHKTLLVDLDAQGNSTHYVGFNAREQSLTVADMFKQVVGIFRTAKKPNAFVHATPYENLFVMPSSSALAEVERELESRYKIFKLKDALKELKDEFDNIFIDTPPNFNFILKRHLLLLMAFASPLIATTSRHRRLSVYLKMQWN